jgi:hypothetical protein
MYVEHSLGQPSTLHTELVSDVAESYLEREIKRLQDQNIIAHTLDVDDVIDPSE